MTFSAIPERYDRMEYRRVGRSGLKLPALSLGLWHNFGDGRPFETQRAIVRRAFDLGITHFDLANNYGPPPGSAEANFGRILAGDLAAYRDEIIVSTKAGYRMGPGPYGEWGSRKNLTASLDASLGRLGLDYVDVYYSHRPDPDTPIEETMGALAQAVRAGKALYVGVSNYSAAETRAARDALAAEGVPLTIHQPRYSVFDRHVEDDGLFDALEELGAGAIVFSPLAQGLLTDRYLGGVPEDSRAATSGFLPRERVDAAYLERARALDAVARGRGQSLAQLALSWVLRVPQIASALIGASSVAQLEQNVAALDAAPLDTEEVAAVEPFTAHGSVLG
ncbi:aldo/keto reductase [Agromyces archimandritae]|uniref:Aldo/keto reductase n=1 Tax=Agromyces archimandritae TaxID=2781962 RepID=A0A975INE5_9MICO|nr:aldo/keto reductase [Agromyces archimandritae]QTX04537.1 aldo/keto reductase [Agromyces archimandritae]